MTQAIRDYAAILAFHRPLWAQFKGRAGSHRPIEEVVPGFHASVQALFDQGYSLMDVGLMFGLSRERIRQFAARARLRPWHVRSPMREWSWSEGRFVPSVVNGSVILQARKRDRFQEKRQQWINGVQERFWKRVKIGNIHECWWWTGHVVFTGGLHYGIMPIYHHGTLYAHRAAWLFTYGKLRPGLQVCHHCDNGLCVNPRHLFEGTAKDNIQDSIRKGRHIASPARRPEMLRMLRRQRHHPGTCLVCHRTWQRGHVIKRYCSAACRERAAYRRRTE